LLFVPLLSDQLAHRNNALIPDNVWLSSHLDFSVAYRNRPLTLVA
jgi:hypothetical protein